MNQKFLNVLYIILGFVAYMIFVSMPGWDILGLIGGFIAAIGIVNLSFMAFPYRKTASDWVIPAVMVIILSAVIYFLRVNSYFGLLGIELQLAQAVMTILTLAPLARLYVYMFYWRNTIEKTE